MNEVKRIEAIDLAIEVVTQNEPENASEVLCVLTTEEREVVSKHKNELDKLIKDFAKYIAECVAAYYKGNLTKSELKCELDYYSNYATEEFIDEIVQIVEKYE